MYIHFPSEILQTGSSELLNIVLDMLNRVFICLTAFLASSGLFSGNGRVDNMGVQAQYLLGLGDYSCCGCPTSFTTNSFSQVLGTLLGEDIVPCL